MDSDLQKAIALVKSGQKKQGGQMLAEIVKRQPKNEVAWLWLADCVSTNQQKVFCLNKVLEINPHNEGVRKLIQKLQSIQEQEFVDNLLVGSENIPHFIQARCPYCEGELMVPTNRKSIKCMFCGGDILVQENNLVASKLKNKVDHLLSLASAAEDAKNYEEAYRYYSQVLEEDASISIAWIGKGVSAGWLSSIQKQRLDEAVTCIAKGVEFGCQDSKLVEHAGLNLIHVAQSYTKSVCEYLEQLYSLHVSPKTSGVPLDPVMAGLLIGAGKPAAKRKINNQFSEVYGPAIIRASKYAWKIFPSIEVATGIYDIIYAVKKTSLGEEIKSNFEQDFQKTRQAIKEKFPQWQPPKPNEDCFIATATMGDYNHPYVLVLREYRDKKLVPNNLGKIIVQIYYLVSPPLANVIRQNAYLRMLSLWFLIRPSVFIVKLLSRV